MSGKWRGDWMVGLHRERERCKRVAERARRNETDGAFDALFSSLLQ